MPELPEVETIRRGLEQELVGHFLNKITVKVDKLFRGDAHLIEGKRLISISRRSKILILNFDKGYLAIHLKMTGQLIFVPEEKPNDLTIGGHPDKAYSLSLPHKHTHIILKFDHGTLYYNDLRKFGWLQVCNTQEEIDKLISHLGPEFTSPDFSLDYFTKKLRGKKTLSIKQALLDQSILSGLGNIYSDESLFCAGLRPDRKSSSLNNQEMTKLYDCIPGVLNLALKHGGTTLKDFRHVNGGYGSYLSYAKVYGREKLPCKVCQSKIETKMIGNRTASFCPICQH